MCAAAARCCCGTRPAAVWATTDIKGTSFNTAYNEGTQRLDAYWSGKNVPEAQIASTVPTFMLMYPDPGARWLRARAWRARVLHV